MREKLALITGANGGIGLAIAEQLWADGYALGLFHRGGRERLDGFLDKHGGTSDDLFTVACDLGDLSSIHAALAQPALAVRAPAVLVNNAGTFKRQSFLEVTEADYESIMTINLTSCFLLTQWAARQMRGAGGGSIVNIASATGSVPGPGIGVYSVAKAGLLMMTRLAAQELGHDGIRVNAVSPGLIITPLTQKSYDDEDERDRRQAMTATGTLGMPEDVAGIVSFLCSDQAKFITGQNMTVDGGAHDGFLRALHGKKH